MQRSHTLNNFNISQSQIGVLNTGAIQRIDTAITLSKGSDAELIGARIKDLAEAVIQSKALDEAAQKEILDLTETLAEEVVGKRKPATVNAVMKAITEKVTNFTVLVAAVDQLWRVLKPMFPV